jgi:hypothetical protein
MTDIAKEFIKKVFGNDIGIKSSTEGKHRLFKPDKLLEPHEKLQHEVNIEQSILKNKIKLKALKSITDEDLNKAFGDLNVDEYISSIITLKVAETVKRKSHMIVSEALEDLDENYAIKNAIKNNVVYKIKEAFKI